LQTNHQTSQTIEVVTTNKMTVRTVLNVYGVFTVLGLIVTIFTTPISISESMVFYFNEELLLEGKKLKEFLFFIIGTALIYFSLVNLYFKYLKKTINGS
jgi:hypothetical protein